MEKNYLNFITEFLDESVEMKPGPTLLKPLVHREPTIKAFIFDVYGTLLISASGDIDESVFSTENLSQAFEAAGIQLLVNSGHINGFLTGMLDEFRQSIKTFHQEEFKEDKPYPEVDILQIWENILFRHLSAGEIHFKDPLCTKCFTFVFEVLSNRIYPMPGMKELIRELSERKFTLGIISNAQFYTPVILNFFLHHSVTDSEQVKPFDPDLTVFSYTYRRSKPDPYLFKLMRDQCIRKYGLISDEILYIGNDMFRDVYPAFQAGFRTALFAGDARSLRLRQEKTELKKIVPDFIITDLMQLLTIVQ